jgi:deazaflavin-dependent oxidoreductase (nitroreductase family)
MQTVMNPLMGLILRSPLHSLMSGSTALITVRGRKSGSPYTLPVQYVQDEQTVYILPGSPERKTWWRNLRGGAEVTLRLRGRQCQAPAELLTGANSIDALQVYYRRFPTSARLAHVRVTPEGSFDTNDLAAAAERAVVVRVKLP